MRVTWSEVGEQSLDLIKARLDAIWPLGSQRTLSAICRAVELASVFPRASRRVPEVNDDDIRETFAADYRIWFRRFDSEDTIEVMVVFYGGRAVSN